MEKLRWKVERMAASFIRLEFGLFQGAVSLRVVSWK